MFHRSQDQQQGFAKNQRVADAQLASLRQLGLIAPEKKGFTSAWGGTQSIASSRDRPRAGKDVKPSTNNTIDVIGGNHPERTFPEKGEFGLVSSCVAFIRATNADARMTGPVARRLSRSFCPVAP